MLKKSSKFAFTKLYAPMKRLPSIFLVCLCLMACGNPKRHNSSKHISEYIKTSSFKGYIFPKEHVIHGMFPQENGYTLNRQQVVQAEKIMQEHMDEVWKVCPSVNLRTYKRQYLGRIDKNGDIIVSIDLIEKSFVDDKELAEDLVMIYDGGCGIINVSVNLTKGTIIHISHNGEA